MNQARLLLLLMIPVGCAPAIDDEGAKSGTVAVVDEEADADTDADTDADRVEIPGEGSYTFVFGYSERPEDYDCELYYEVETFFTDVDCDGCDFAFEVVGDLQDGSYGERACDWGPIGEFELAVFYSGRYSEVYYYYAGYGYYGWYPVYYSTLRDGVVELNQAFWDYEYNYGRYTYYITYVMEGEMTVPTEE